MHMRNYPQAAIVACFFLIALLPGCSHSTASTPLRHLENTLFLGTTNTSTTIAVQAIDPANGQVHWKASIDGFFPSYCYTHRVVIIQTNIATGNLTTALDADTGKQLWQASIPALIFACGGGIVAHEHQTIDTSQIIALDAVTGTQIWQANLPRYPLSPVNGAPLAGASVSTLVISNEQVIAGYDSFPFDPLHAGLIVWNAQTGAQIWQTTLDHFVQAPISIVATSTAIFATLSSNPVFQHTNAPMTMVDLDAATGKLQWANHQDIRVTAATPDLVYGMTLQKPDTSTVLGQVSALDRATGLLKWKTPQLPMADVLPIKSANLMQVTGNTVIVPSLHMNTQDLLNGIILSFDATTGQPGWQLGSAWWDVVSGNGQIFTFGVQLPTGSGKSSTPFSDLLEGCDAQTGHIQWKMRISSLSYTFAFGAANT